MVRRRRGRTTISVPGVRVCEDLVDRVFGAAAPDRLWVADITYLRTWEGWLYLVAVQDVYSRRIVGWSMADLVRTELVTDALEMALAQRRPAQGLIWHSDQGSQPGLKGSSQHRVIGERTVASESHASRSGGWRARDAEGTRGAVDASCVGVRQAAAAGDRAPLKTAHPIRAEGVPRYPDGSFAGAYAPAAGEVRRQPRSGAARARRRAASGVVASARSVSEPPSAAMRGMRVVADCSHRRRGPPCIASAVVPDRRSS